ncbi:hypothetical protein F441_06785 [Phytophthora nicotianae CJ01A1]|uniref:HAT C-terminal dimerisation domain-containing protein n=1 Tax=Phytophthora nicotianae CJ01A1 TaxID=1317063 RepID=W2X8C3_PHYNI|nr:hypothetical protein F441_06785 [Phytophthora nicotianae CJ01A1]
MRAIWELTQTSCTVPTSSRDVSGSSVKDLLKERATVTMAARSFKYFKKRRRREESMPEYELLGCIPPTSNIVERFFSVARTTYGQERHSLNRITLEMVLFLRQNSVYWAAQTVDDATR